MSICISSSTISQCISNLSTPTSLVNDKGQICAEWTLTISQNCSHKWNNKKKLMQPCNRRFDRLITIDCMLLKRICRRTPKPFVPNVFTEQAYVFNSGIQYQEWNPAHVSLEFCWHCIRNTLDVFVFISRMKSSTCFLGILLALLQKNASRVCL